MRKTVERIIISIVGMSVLSVGIGVIVNSNFGSDTLTLLEEALQHNFGLTIGTYNTLLGIVMVIVSFFCDKRKIGFATIYYVIVGKFIIDGTIELFPVAETIPMKLLFIALAIALVSVGSSLAICSRFGLSFYDAFLYSVTDRFKFNYVIFRYIVEACFLVISLILHTYPNIGTIIYFVLFGPSITFTLKLIKKPFRQHWNMPYED